jgi:Armadillo/beta-catenin-like repeat
VANKCFRKLALGIIRNLSSQDENESVLVAQGALRPLLQLLDSDIDLSIRIEVLKTIRNLSFAPDSRVEIKRYIATIFFFQFVLFYFIDFVLRHRGLEPILRHLHGVPNHATDPMHKRRDCADCLELRRMAIRVVSIISGDTDIRKEVRNFGVNQIVHCVSSINGVCFRWYQNGN